MMLFSCHHPSSCVSNIVRSRLGSYSTSCRPACWSVFMHKQPVQGRCPVSGGTCLLWIDIGTVFPLLTRIYQIKHHIMYTVNFYYAFTVNVYWLDHASVYELIEVTIS